jgi:cell fate regulator YaaT (PSP1 superfamily)
MAVSFDRYGKLYYLDPAGHEPRVGDMVLVPTDEGPEVAECVWAPQWVSEDIGGLLAMAGFASEADLERDRRNRRRRAEVKMTARRTITASDVPMKVVAVDVVDRASPPRVVIYFTAPHRVDFRMLVRDLARALDSKVELRHLSDRDGARAQGGIGPCGRDTCCSTFLKDFEPVSVRMAKDQGLPVNPLSISGACGRLLCCLKYEHPLYQDFAKRAPAVGSTVGTPEGDGRVVGHNVPSESVTVRLAGSGGSCRCSLADVCAPRGQYDDAVAAGARRDAGLPAGDGEPPSAD